MKIVADVNVIVSSTIAPLGMSRSSITAWREGSLGLLTSEGIIVEVEEKLRSPRISVKYGLAEEDILAATATLRTQAEVVHVPLQVITPVTGDPEDDYVLATAALGRADWATHLPIRAPGQDPEVADQKAEERLERDSAARSLPLNHQVLLRNRHEQTTSQGDGGAAQGQRVRIRRRVIPAPDI